MRQEIEVMARTYAKSEICEALILSRRKFKKREGEFLEMETNLFQIAEELGFLPKNATQEKMICKIRELISNQKES